MPFSDRILTTKLQPPRVGVRLLERPRLWEILEGYQSKRLVLVSAPAGYGKTVTISQFVKQLSSPAVWYHLDYYDNDFNMFIQHLLIGLDRAFAGVATDMLYLIERNNNLSSEIPRITAALVNSLLDRMEDKLVFVIDDYHFIEEKAVHSFMEQFLHYVPEGVHIFMNCRAKPPLNLERLKVAGLVKEIGMEELRFNRDEIAGFLVTENSETISNETVDFLEEKTGGWPAALRLAGMAMSGGNSIKTGIKEMLPQRKEIYQYLAAEVLSDMPSYLSNFVLSTSVLDIMTPEICDLLLERTDSKNILEELELRNLFITSTEGEYRVYRYHPLFREFLQSQLREEQKRALWEKGGYSYEQNSYYS